jgi:hypothetical protein
MVSRMKKVEPTAWRAKEKAKSFFEQDDRINTLFDLYDETIDSWALSRKMRSSRSVKFRILSDGGKEERKINGVRHEFETCKFKINGITAQIAKCYPDPDHLSSVLFLLSIENQVTFTATIGVFQQGLTETDRLFENGTLESVEEFYFTPKLIELINLYRKLLQEHSDVEEDRENKRLNKLYEGKFRFDGLDDWERSLTI